MATRHFCLAGVCAAKGVLDVSFFNRTTHELYFASRRWSAYSMSKVTHLWVSTFRPIPPEWWLSELLTSLSSLWLNLNVKWMKNDCSYIFTLLTGLSSLLCDTRWYSADSLYSGQPAPYEIAHWIPVLDVSAVLYKTLFKTQKVHYSICR